MTVLINPGVIRSASTDTDLPSRPLRVVPEVHGRPGRHIDVRVFFVVEGVREVAEEVCMKEVEVEAEAVQAELRGERNRIRIMIVSSRVL